MHRDGWDAAWKFAGSYGRDEAVSATRVPHERADEIFARMMATPAQTQAGRAAKVRTLLIHVMDTPAVQWRGPSRELEYDIDFCRRLLGESAGMTEEELAAI